VSSKRPAGTVVLIGGGEWRDGCRSFDAELLATAGRDVVVLPSAAAFEQPDRVVERAEEYFSELGASVVPLMVLHRAEAEDKTLAATVAKARFIYLSDGSPMHLRSVLKDSAVFAALVDAYDGGAVVAASGAGATVLCDPMVDPRGGAYTVGLGLVRDLAVFPYHGTAAGHLRERSIDFLPATARLVGVDEQTALIRGPDGAWRVGGAGHVTVYEQREAAVFDAGSTVDLLNL
jgi:cyanophycinase